MDPRQDSVETLEQECPVRSPYTTSIYIAKMLRHLINMNISTP